MFGWPRVFAACVDAFIGGCNFLMGMFSRVCLGSAAYAYEPVIVCFWASMTVCVCFRFRFGSMGVAVVVLLFGDV